MKYIGWYIAAAALLLIIIFRKQIRKLFGMNGTSSSATQADGTVCQTTDTPPLPGTYQSGVCVPDRVGQTRNDVSDNLQEFKGSAAPPYILLPASSNCRIYTSAKPYHYQGCSYVFAGYISQAGVRYCQLKLVSCP